MPHLAAMKVSHDDTFVKVTCAKCGQQYLYFRVEGRGETLQDYLQWAQEETARIHEQEDGCGKRP